MAEQIEGNNATGVQDPVRNGTTDIKAVLQDQISKFRAENADAPKAEKNESATATAEARTLETPTPDNGKKVDSMQQFRDKEGNVDLAKIEKTNENLAKGTKDKEERIQSLLQRQKELQREFTRKAQEAKTLEKEVQRTDAPSHGDFRTMSPELKKRFLEDVEKDPADAILRLSRMVADSEVRALREELQSLKNERRERSQAESLDSLGQSGNEWVYTAEGEQWFQERFREEPALLQMADPYRSAVRMFRESLPKGAQNGTAQPGKPTPILGSAHAAPPPSSAPTETPVQKLEKLAAKMGEALKLGDIQEAKKIELEMRRANLQIHGSM